MPADTNTKNGPHLLFVLGINMRGGAEISMLTLARGLRQKGYRVTIAAFGRASELAVKSRASGIDVVQLNEPRTFRAAVPLYKLLRKLGPDIIVSAMTHTNVMVLGVALAARTGAPVVVTEHGQTALNSSLSTGLGGKLLPKLAGLLYARAAEVVAVSKGLAVYIDKIIPWRRHQPVRVIYNPVIPASFSPAAGAPHAWLEDKNVPVVMSVGRLEKEKNFAQLVSAFAQVARARPVRLIILGEGSEKTMLELLAEKLGVREHVFFPGFKRNVHDWLDRASVFVCSSISEGFGNAIVEAMACGLTVVSTNCPYGPAEILEKGMYGHLVPPGNTDAMANAIQEAIDRPMDKNFIRSRAANFNEVQCFEAYDALLRGLRGAA